MAPAVPSTFDSDRSRTLAKRGFGIVVLWRLLYLIPFTEKFDLAGDESYYWDWGRQLDWGYFSKPPMIGWIMGLVGRLSGDTEWGVRLGSLVLGSISLWLLYKLADRMFGPRTALFALLLGALTPANAGLNLLLTIDAPLVLCWTAALLVFLELLEKPERTSRWVLLMVIMGLGYLSKQMMLVFPLLMIVFCRLQPEARPLLRMRAFWWCIVTSLLFMVPVIIWNAQHGWVTVQHTGSHFQVKPDTTLLDHVGMFFGFLGLQAVIFTPLTWLLMVTAAFGGLKKWRTLNAAERYLVLFSAPALAVFVLLSLRQNVNANWPAVFYLGAVVLTAAWIDRKALSFLHWPKLDQWARRAIWIGLVCSVGVYFLILGIEWVGLAGTRFDPALRLRGWREVGQLAQGFLNKTPHPQRTFVVAMGERDHASELAFYMPSHPQVFRYRPADVIESQYEIWPDPGDMGFIGGDALIFKANDDFELPPSLLRGFRNGIEKIGEIHAKLGSQGAERYYQVFLGKDLKYWPGPPTAEEIAKMQQEQQAKAQAQGGAAGK
jgi:hypothetical protein